MVDESTSREFEVFKEAIRDENLEVQIEVTKKLGVLAKHLGEELTRNELLPFIKENIDFHDEILVNLSEQLEQFIPLVGGYEHAQPVLDLLQKLCNTDETIVRDKTVETLKHIADNLTTELTEQLFLPVVESLANEYWFTSKCSAAALYPAIYRKVREEKKPDLRNSFRVLLQDDSPIVRKAAVLSLIELIPLLDKQCIINEFIPVFDNVAKDTMDSVRVFAVDIGIVLAKRLTETEIDEFIFSTLESWADDQSWRIRHKLAYNLQDIQSAIPFGKMRGRILAIFQKLAKDPENEVRVFIAINVFSYCRSLQKSYEGQPGCEDNFEPVFEESIVPQIRLLAVDPVDEVRLALSSNILTLGSILSDDCFKRKVLPIIIEILEHEPSMPVQENMLQNLNSFPKNLDFTQSLYSIKTVVRSLIVNSQAHWRTRRSLLVAFMHIATFANKEYFSENLKIFYAALLGDPVFAVRRTAPIILPLLAGQYGMKWTTENIIPFFKMFTKDCRYLYRYVPVFGINELISPSLLDNNSGEKLLTNLKAALEDTNSDVKESAIKILARLTNMTAKLKRKLDENTFNDILSLNKCIDDFKSDNIKLYAGETLEVLRKNHDFSTFSFVNENIHNEIYLEELLLVIYKEFLHLILNLFDDPIVNVQIRSVYILNKISEFVNKLRNELSELWVKEAMLLLGENELDDIEKQIDLEMIWKPVETSEDEEVDTKLMEKIPIAQQHSSDQHKEFPELVNKQKPHELKIEPIKEIDDSTENSIKTDDRATKAEPDSNAAKEETHTEDERATNITENKCSI